MHTEYIISGGEYQPPDTLHDVSLAGRVRPWRRWKLDSELLAEAYETASSMVAAPASVEWALRADRVRTCGTHPTFERHTAPEGQYLTLQSADFCRDRLCPLCQWRRSLKLGGQCRAVVAEADRRKIARDRVGWRWLMLTLTQRNIEGPNLGAELDRMHAAVRVLTKSPRWRAAVRGWLRVTEITRNTNYRSPFYGTYHPHLHILLAVPRSYLRGRDYIPHAEWVQMWRAYMHLDYLPSVDIRVVTDKGEVTTDSTPQSMGAAVAEVAKYAAKPSSYLIASDLEATVDAVTTLARALKGRRLYAWGGVCKDAAQALHLDSLETGDLVHIDEDATGDLAADAVSQYVAYHWALGIRNYVQDRTWDAPASWAAAAAAAAERPKLAAAQRAKETAYDDAARAKIRRLESAAGPRIAHRAIRAHDGYTMTLLEEVAAARDRQRDTPPIPGPAHQDSPPCDPPPAGD